MLKHALIFIPSQGKGVKQFSWCAHALKTQIYGLHAIIVKTEVVLPKTYLPWQIYDEFEVKFVTEKDHKFSLKKHHDLSTFIIISHAGPTDGPNLTYGAGGYQPWSAYEPHGSDGNPYGSRQFKIDMLRPRSRKFWQAVGTCLSTHGKIILLGCNYAQGSYIQHVANASGRMTYGSGTSLAAGDVTTVVGIVRDIEHDKLTEPMKKAEPQCRSHIGSGP